MWNARKRNRKVWLVAIIFAIFIWWPYLDAYFLG